MQHENAVRSPRFGLDAKTRAKFMFRRGHAFRLCHSKVSNTPSLRFLRQLSQVKKRPFMAM